MNIHHLELFYHVARCKGVSAAARQMPYGIQQPAISAQILQLEDSLGKALFHRRPFALTPEGETLFAFIEPFFSKLPGMAERLRGGADNSLRIACPEIVQRDYLPALIAAVRKRVPDFHFTLGSGRVDEIESQLRSGRIDLGLATSAGSKDDGIHTRELLKMPLVLLVPEKGGPATAAEILDLDRIDLPLVTLPRGEPAVVAFQQELQRRKIEWFPMLELASLDLVARFAASGYGAGLVLDIPGASRPPGLKALPLEGFPEISFHALTLGKLSPMVELFIEEAGKGHRGIFLIETGRKFTSWTARRRHAIVGAIFSGFLIREFRHSRIAFVLILFVANVIFAMTEIAIVSSRKGLLRLDAECCERIHAQVTRDFPRLDDKWKDRKNDRVGGGR